MSIFHTLENAGKRLLAGSPRLKAGIKHVYQRSAYVFSPRVKREGALTRLTPEDGASWFFGYYDKSPWDITGKRVLCLRAETVDSPAPDATVGIYLIENGAPRKIAETRAWNTQQGCMLGWLGPDYNDKIMYNDFRDGKYVSVVFSANENREIRTYEMPVYAVSQSGETALTLDFARLNRLRPGYGYSNIPDATWGDLCPDAPCAWKIDLKTGEISPILTYTGLRAFEEKTSMAGAEHKINHLMINPSGTRFMALHRWMEGKRKHTRLITFDMDGTNPFTLADEDFVSHCCWANDTEIISYCRLGGADGYYRLRDRTLEHARLWRELDTDGHMSVAPDGRVITDTYPDNRRLQSVYVMDGGKVTRLARVFSPFKFDGDVRCDLHPRFDRTGERVAIDATFSGKRALYSLPSVKIAPPPKVLTVITVPMTYDGPTVSVLRYARAMDRNSVSMDFLSINDPADTIKADISAMGGRLFVMQGRLKRPIGYMLRLAALARREKYDIMHVHGNSSTMAIELLAAYLGGVKVRVAHSRNSHCKYLKLHKLLKPLFMRLYTHAYACGDEAGRWLFGERPFTVARIAVETESYAFDPAARAKYRRQLGAGESMLIGSVAHFTPHKNHVFLLEAFAEYLKIDPSAKLVLVGDGVLRGEVERKIQQLSIESSVIRLGVRTDVPALIQAFDVMLLPSLYEGFPNVLVEWQCAGLPALVSDTVTRAAALTPLVKFLPISGGVAPWADALMRVNHSGNRALDSRNAINAVRKQGYDITENAREMQKFYTGTPGRRGKA